MIKWPCFLHDCISPRWEPDEPCVEFWNDYSGSTEILTFNQFSSYSDELANLFRVLIEKRYPTIGRKCVIAIVWSPNILTSVFVHSILKSEAIFYPVLPHMCLETLTYFENHLVAILCSNNVKTFVKSLHNFESYNSDLHLNSRSVFHRCDWELFVRSCNDCPILDHLPQMSPFMNSLPAYVITTSGSFSKDKKIVCVAHSCLTANILDLVNRFGSCEPYPKPTKSVLLASPLTFDPSIVQIYFSLCSHRRLIIPSATVFVGPLDLANLCMNAQVDWLQCTPSQFTMVDPQSRLNLLSNPDLHLIFGGEPFPLALFSNRRLIQASIYGIYGTTEVSSWATFHSWSFNVRLKNEDCFCSPPVQGATPIGYPMFATQTKLVETDNPGTFELYLSRQLGGFSIIRLNSSSIITDQEFNQAIWSLPCVQMWKTGDLVRLGSCTKCLWYIGRKDRTVKRLGYQICLERLEHIVSSFRFPHLELQRCRCQVPDSVNQGQLVLFLEVKERPISRCKRLFVSCKNWRRRLQNDIIRRLRKIFYPNPDPWLPSNCVISRTPLPTSAHGKLVYKPFNLHTRSYNTKSQILHLWNSALGRQDSFDSSSNLALTELGVTSLSAVIFVETLLHRYPKLRSLRSKVMTKVLTKSLSQCIKFILKCLANRKNCTSFKLNNHSAVIKSDSDNHESLDYHLINLEETSSLSVLTRGQYLYLDNLSNHHISVTPKWQSVLGKCVDASPIIISPNNSSSHQVFIGSHSGLFACLELSTGQSAWSQCFLDLTGRIEASACAMTTHSFSNPIVAVGTLDGKLYTVETEYGTIINCYDTGGAVKSSPMFVPIDDLLVCGSHGKLVHAYDLRAPSSSQSVWSCSLDDSAIVASISGFQSEEKTFRSILVSTLGGSLGCLDIRNPEKPLWVHHDDIPIFCKPVSSFFKYSNSLTFRVSVDGTVSALSTLTGQVHWKTKPLLSIGNYSVFSDPVVKLDDQTLILTTNNGFIYALDIFDGQVSWILDCRLDLKPNESSSSSLNTPFLIHTDSKYVVRSLLVVTRADGMIILCSIPQKSTLVQLPDVVCTYHLPDKCFSSPVLCNISNENDCLYLVCGCRDDRTYCFSLSGQMI